jgi:hypothetical protein
MGRTETIGTHLQADNAQPPSRILRDAGMVDPMILLPQIKLLAARRRQSSKIYLHVRKSHSRIW